MTILNMSTYKSCDNVCFFFYEKSDISDVYIRNDNSQQPFFAEIQLSMPAIGYRGKRYFLYKNCNV